VCVTQTSYLLHRPDGNFNSYYSTDSLPLKLLLGVPVYLEVNLWEGNRGRGRRCAVLVVNYCVAFPRNAEKALVLVYEGQVPACAQDVGIWMARVLIDNLTLSFFVAVQTKTTLLSPSCLREARAGRRSALLSKRSSS